MVRSVGGMLAVLSFLVAGCAEPPAEVTAGAWPTDVQDEKPDVIDIVVEPNVVITPPELVDTVIVAADRLIFAADQRDAVEAAFPVGAPVVGGRAEGIDANPNNLLGFMRKVTEVRVEGDAVIVETEPATLTDIMSGTVSQTFDPADAVPLDYGDIPLEAFFPAPSVENGGDNTGGEAGGFVILDGDLTTPAIALSLDGTIPNIVNIDETFPVNGGAATMRVRGKGDFTGAFAFSPRFHLDWDISPGSLVPPRGPRLDTFEVSARGDLRAASRIDFDITAAVVTGEADEIDLDGSVPAFPDGGGWVSKLVRESRPYLGPTIGPVPTTFRVYLFLDCRYAVKGNVNGFISTAVDVRGAKVGAEYDRDNDGWKPIADFPITATGQAVINKGGAAIVECGLRPQVEWRFADVGGPYINGRASLELSGSYDEICPAEPQTFSVPSDGVAQVALASNFNVDVGGEVDLFVTDVGIGPFNVYSRRFDGLYSRQLTFPRTGAQTCLGSCDDGALGAGESDVDCSGACPKCADGRSCAGDADCVSQVCSVNNLCVRNACFNGRRDGDESDIDCGFSCGTSCGAGGGCGRDRDCNPGFCNLVEGRCVDDPCFNGRQDFTETSIDCGGACATKCPLSFPCVVGDDCTTGVCNIDNQCVADRCLDGRKNFDESDVDCGGPTCLNRCLGGCQADSDCRQDQGARVCGAQNQCVTSCQDGRLSAGERDVDCGGVCATGPSPQRCAVNGACSSDDDCASGVCNESRGRCALNACSDGELSAGETATDCGGPTCLGCGLQKRCSLDRDCQSGVCGAGGTCAIDQCSDGVTNGSETDVDCGGTCRDDCPTGGGCDSAADCKSELCIDNICTSDACKDRLQRGTETDVDCGGSCAADCATGDGCLANTDCESGICNTFTKVCVADTCADGLLNNDETDVDCGGSCDGCAAGNQCDDNLDCDSGVCNINTLICAVDSCGSGLIDGTETDVDCGGSCARKCGFADSCRVGGDCASGECLPGNTCSQDPCSDGAQNGDETGVDCGGSCQDGCAAGNACVVSDDCLSGFCQVGTNICVDDHCVDGVKDANESGLDCGGPACGACGVGQQCLGNSDCGTGLCSRSGFCVADRCQDGFANGGETDVDCGGQLGIGCAAKCFNGQGCNTFNDCAQGPGNPAGTTNGESQCVTGRCTATLPESCRDILLRQGGFANDGTFQIDHDGRDRDTGVVNVFCDMQNGGWTLAWMLNSQFALDSQTPARGGDIELFFGTSSVPDGVSVDPARGLFGVGTLPFGPDAGCIGGVVCSSTQVNYQKLKFTSYVNGSKVFESEELAMSQWRFLTTRVVPFSAVGGYYFHDAGLGARRYFMCGGNRIYTNTGAGEVNPANGFAPNQPCKGVDLNGGYDFSETRFFEHRGLSATGLTNFSGRMTTGNPNNNVFVNYGTPGAIHAAWVK